MAGTPLLQRQWCRGALPETNTAWRLALGPGFSLPTMDAWRLLHRGPHSRIYRADAATSCVLKLVLPRSQPRDTARKYIACQAKREFHGNRTLTALGLQAPAVYGWGISLSPFARFESALFMRALPDFVTGLTLIREETGTDKRYDFLHRLAGQLACLQGQGYIHKDAHFANLCVLDDGSLVWIDNDIRRPGTVAARRKGLRKTLALLESTARSDVTPAEWRQFRQWLRMALARWPQGGQLADEIP